jgi:hypothetical protein
MLSKTKLRATPGPVSLLRLRYQAVNFSSWHSVVLVSCIIVTES